MLIMTLRSDEKKKGRRHFDAAAAAATAAAPIGRCVAGRAADAADGRMTTEKIKIVQLNC